MVVVNLYGFNLTGRMLSLGAPTLVVALKSEAQPSLLPPTHPAEGLLTTAVLRAFNFEKTTAYDREGQRQLIYGLGKQLADNGISGLSTWTKWLQQFVKDGCLSEKQAAKLDRKSTRLNSSH